ncbi:MAG: thioredoxin domain-containing protein, partial [Bacteroidota bacterium]
YSTDGIWKVPHFEKMLYDNAQLISLYSKAYQFWQDPNDCFVIEKSFEFILDSLTGPHGEFYSALDADSEGEEGKYYVWKIDELKQLLQEDFDLFGRYFNINQTGYWEHDHYILIRTEKDDQFCDIHHLQYSDFLAKKNKWMSILLNARKERIAPGLDDKTLTSWNALMLKACLDAYISIGRQVFLDAAIKNADFILNHQLQQSSALYHTFKNGKSAINGFLEDYALLADAFVMLYKVTGNDTWLTKARDLADYALMHFYDPADGLFYFNSNDDKPLIARQKEVQDNVIPSSNAVMAHVLFDLSIYFENNSYRDTSAKMLAHFYDEMISYGSAYSCWAMLMLKFEAPVLQVAIPVKDFKEAAQHVLKSKHINLYTYCNTAVSCLPFIADKMHSANYYLCTNNVCGLPLNNQNELISAIEKV